MSERGPDPGSSKGFDRYAYVNNNPVNFNDPSGHFAWLPILVAGGALIGAGINYGTQVYNNMQENGGDLGQALTQNIDLMAIGESAIAGSAVGLTIGVAAPVAVSLVGQGLTGIGLIAGSTSAFAAGMYVSDAATTLTSAVWGASSVSSPTIKPGSAGGSTAGKPFSESIRQQAFEEDPTQTCVWCGTPGAGTQVDHAVPRSLGGNATIDNAQLACPHCNASRGARDFPVTPPDGYRGAWPPPWWPHQE